MRAFEIGGAETCIRIGRSGRNGTSGREGRVKEEGPLDRIDSAAEA
jgi:hypothetical protein